MLKATYFSLFLLLAGLAIAAAQIRANTERSARQLAITGEAKTIEYQGRQREYRIHVPKSVDKDRAVPLVLFLHGGAGTAEQASRMGMTQVADRHNFIVVYPNAIDKHWHDGRDYPRCPGCDARYGSLGAGSRTAVHAPDQSLATSRRDNGTADRR